MREAPLYFVWSGYYYYNGSMYYIGSSGGYWSSTASRTTNAYYLNFSPTNVDPQNNRDRGVGFSVRYG